MSWGAFNGRKLRGGAFNGRILTGAAFNGRKLMFQQPTFANGTLTVPSGLYEWDTDASSSNDVSPEHHLRMIFKPYYPQVSDDKIFGGNSGLYVKSFSVEFDHKNTSQTTGGL